MKRRLMALVVAGAALFGAAACTNTPAEDTNDSTVVVDEDSDRQSEEDLEMEEGK